jgi:hypothetical protein
MQSSALAVVSVSTPATTATTSVITPSFTTTTRIAAGTVASGATAASLQPFQPTPLGPVGTVRTMIQLGGFRALYTGLAMPLAAQAVYKGTVFTVNNLTEAAIIEWKTQQMTSKWVSNHNDNNFSRTNTFNTTIHELTLIDRFISGFMGGAINAALFCTPVEYVRNQQIVHMGTTTTATSSTTRNITPSIGNTVADHGPISVIRRTIQSNGIAGLWKGTVSTVLRDSVGCGLFFMTIAYSQQKLMVSPLSLFSSSQHQDGNNSSLSSSPSSPSSSSSSPTTSVIITSGAMAGIAFWLWALPIDTMKTWIQSGRASSMTNAIELLRRNGLRTSVPSLFRGWQVAYGRGAPSAAITVVTYSFVMRHLLDTEKEE